MKICVIGANGFLARSYGKYFDNYEIVTLDVYGISLPTTYEYSGFVQFDLTKEEKNLTVFLEYDYIFYLAGKGVQSTMFEPSAELYQVNAFFPIKLILFLKENSFKGKIITFGSYFEVGNCNEDISFSETELASLRYLVPNNYCLSKRILTRFIDSIIENNFIYHFILPTIFGYGEDKKRLIPFVIEKIKKEEDLLLTSGLQVREYIYVDDIPIITKPIFNNTLKPGIYNINGTEKLTIKDLVTKIADYFNYPQEKLIFGGENRNDVSMLFLSLNGTKLNSISKTRPNTLIIDKIDEYKNGI